MLLRKFKPTKDKFKTRQNAYNSFVVTLLGVEVLQGLRVAVDDVEVVLEPGHLTFVPRGFQLAKTSDLVDEFLLFANPQ